jgi:murein DD-endopeptidase MepM/ murein hydrolase activator NlpD
MSFADAGLADPDRAPAAARRDADGSTRSADAPRTRTRGSAPGAGAGAAERGPSALAPPPAGGPGASARSATTPATSTAANGATPAAPHAADADLAELDGPERPVPPVSVPAPESIASEPPSGPPIDAVLVRFASEARGLRGRFPAGRGFPEEALAGWDALVRDLDRYLERPLPETPLMEIVRARVTVEAEWDYDVRRYGAPPRPAARAVKARVDRLARRLETGRAIGLALFAKPAPARLVWPIPDAGLSSLFGMRVHPLDGVRRMHHGIDLTAAPGRVVGAAAQGWVVRAGWAGGYGLVVEVRHPGDLTTRYSHLSALLCAPGDPVDPGSPLGLVGKTGRATGPHLHFEVWRGGEARDPLPYLGAARVVARAEPRAGAPGRGRAR